MKLRYHTTAFAAAISLASCTAEHAREEVGERSLPDQAPLTEAGANATAILNAGVSANIGDPGDPVKFLFDPIYDNHFGSLQPLDMGLIDRIVSGAPPYDGVDAVFVSHAHGDHFSARHLNRLLGAQSEVRLVAPVQAVDMMREDDGWDPAFAARIDEISLGNGEQAPPLTIAGATIEAFRSPHNGWPDRHADVHNITYRVSASDAADGTHRVMHLGDAGTSTEFFEPHSEFLSSSRTGLAIVPFWFLREDEIDSLIDRTLNAEAAAGMHVPVEEPGWLSDNGRPYFTEEGQSVPVPSVTE
ncbi:MBL fold metallo-hydrolase [Erythrobacter rubeus]|uniref:MBL fold metallo-hydrolase n=1 Tax=Erythrobacter rubeus TaxID=2760803 RepID=A0ABR8KRL2_9SPHN|nr:MBL fold metallo-hydrolase [Erythrobacter rubeus]MBD2840882.1 MBL fold metallo-hydrolase [Erythrobacter rubeus]